MIVEDGVAAKAITTSLRKAISNEEAECERDKDGEIPLGKMPRCRVRYFTDGAVTGSRIFTDEAFVKSRKHFRSKRKTGARKMNGNAAPASGALWSVRDLRMGLT